MRGIVPAGGGWFTRESVARQRRDHDIERVFSVPAERGWIGERADDLQLLDDRAGPPVRNDYRQRVRIFRADVDEMNIESVDVGYEVRQRLQFLLALAPVVILRPIAREFLYRRQLHALRLIGDGFFSGPARCGNTAPEIIKVLLRHGRNGEGPDCRLILRSFSGRGRMGSKQ